MPWPGGLVVCSTVPFSKRLLVRSLPGSISSWGTSRRLTIYGSLSHRCFFVSLPLPLSLKLIKTYPLVKIKTYIYQYKFNSNIFYVLQSMVVITITRVQIVPSLDTKQPPKLALHLSDVAPQPLTASLLSGRTGWDGLILGTSCSIHRASRFFKNKKPGFLK